MFRDRECSRRSTCLTIDLSRQSHGLLERKVFEGIRRQRLPSILASTPDTTLLYAHSPSRSFPIRQLLSPSKQFDTSRAISIDNFWNSWKAKQADQAKAMKQHVEARRKPVPDELEQWLAATKVLIDHPLGNGISHSNSDDLPRPSTSGCAQRSAAPKVTQWPPRLQRSKKPHELCVKPPNPLIRAWASNKRLWRYRCAVVHKRVFELRHE